MNFPGEKFAFVGGGGGSDCIQASVLAELTGKPACVISVREDKTSSQNPDSGAMGESRTVQNHGGEVSPGVFRIKPETTGSGRFFENLPAERWPMYLVVDSKNGRLREQMQAALDDFGGVDTVVDVDTGGDCLYRTSFFDATQATPDQDLESLIAVSGLNAPNLLSCVIAVGIDAPDYADEILRLANARLVHFSPSQRDHILGLYREFELDGSNETRYGKTPFAWQAALRGETGRIRLPLPDRVVNDPRNPWDPYVVITPEMAGGYVMDVHDHLCALFPHDQPIPDVAAAWHQHYRRHA